MKRRNVIAWLAVATCAGANPARVGAETPCSGRAHVDWVAEALERMQSIQPAMTRQQLLEVFTTEGGLSTGLRRTYVSRDCPFFKVDVEFEPVGRPARDTDGRVSLEERDQDTVAKISRPYLQFTIAD